MRVTPLFPPSLNPSLQTSASSLRSELRVEDSRAGEGSLNGAPLMGVVEWRRVNAEPLNLGYINTLTTDFLTMPSLSAIKPGAWISSGYNIQSIFFFREIEEKKSEVKN